MNTEEAIRNLGNELALLTGDNYARIAKLENALADARRNQADLVELVERMGRDLDEHCMVGFLSYPYTVISQREYDAAMHEAEGPPPDAGMLENVQ